MNESEFIDFETKVLSLKDDLTNIPFYLGEAEKCYFNIFWFYETYVLIEGKK